MELHVRDAPDVLVRRIRPDDKPLLVWGLRQASDESIHRRFLGPKPRLSAVELRYLTELDFVDHYALVAVLADEPDALVAVGRWVRDRKDRESAEMAIIVADELQGRGLGTQLGLMLADAARERGIRRFTATMLADNRPAHALMARISAHMETEYSGALQEVVAEFPRRDEPPRLPVAAA